MYVIAVPVVSCCLFHVMILLCLLASRANRASGLLALSSLNNVPGTDFIKAQCISSVAQLDVFTHVGDE